MLQNINIDVKSLFILSLMKESNEKPKWVAVEVHPKSDLLDDLKKTINIKVDDEGLVKIKSDLCNVCEFRHLCWKQSIETNR